MSPQKCLGRKSYIALSLVPYLVTMRSNYEGSFYLLMAVFLFSVEFLHMNVLDILLKGKVRNTQSLCKSPPPGNPTSAVSFSQCIRDICRNTAFQVENSLSNLPK